MIATKTRQNLLRRRRGQGMTEYIIIVALIAIAAIAVITLFGDNIRGLFGMSANALAGDEQVDDFRNKSDDSVHKRNMQDFGSNNRY